ncbi:hypothetical protein GQX73_g2507 [Xylaria multiplex]|uniref:RNA polymerase II degradation factor 1 n=1 Tax=Xylaria multiplex TaxID=323545 RepID=A0A7C8NB22_9PEZI|nr:hypothetical protein GQX73_g2507 [Xylaria multiplex]
MAEVQPRSQNPTTRGRGGGRGGRGGFGGRNTTARRANGDKTAATEPAAFDDDGDIAQLRQQYGEKLGLIKELFEEWSDADILYALKETDGDVELTATRIAEGTISQWGEVSKTKKPAARPKTKSDTPSTGAVESPSNSRPARGGRSDGGRGGRARGNERARGGRGRGAAHATTNGHRAKDNNQLSVPTDEASAWSGAVVPDESHSTEWTNPTPALTDSTTDNAPVSTSEPVPKPAAAPAPKTWASMLRQSTAVPKPAPKPKEAPVPKPAEIIEPLPPTEPVVPEPEPEPQVEETPTPVEAPVESPVPTETVKIVEPEVALPPSEDDLTKVNLDLLPDESHPPTTATAASTAADSWDARQTSQPSAAVTPLSASQAQHQASRPATSGYAATALKATERPATRMPSYQRRLLEQEEAVRMPGNREVDRAAVQFGAFSLNGAEDDIDGDREDPETRTQPPAESPAAPRASLPPIAQPASVPESFPSVQKPTTSQPQVPGAAVTPVAPPTGPASSVAQPPQAPSSNQPYGRFHQPSGLEPAGFTQKPYDTFNQQPATTSTSFDSFPATTTQAPGPQTSGAFTSGPNDYTSYYTADQQTRNTYGGYYGYGQQQGGQNHGEPNATNRPFATYNASQSDNLSQYPQSGAQQTRYPGAASTDAHNSGHNTPNPVGQNQQQTSGQGAQPQSNIHQPPNYPYSHPYYSSPYYGQFVSGPYAGYGQGGYGGAPYGKGGVYGQHHQYGMSPQGPFDHGSTAGTGGFGQSSVGSRDTGLNSGINDFGRGTGQQSGAPGALSSGGFSGVHDSYGRGAGFPSQGGQAFNTANASTSTPGSGNDDLKPYGDSKAGGGPSPSLATAARPGSTTNATPAASGLPPPQSTQQGMGGYGGYPGHLNQGLHSGQTGASGYGLSGSGSQGHANTSYGGYGQGFGYYGGGRQNHQGGWGGNYH